ncbi:MAG: DUF429 domain-containing protein [Sulfolobaceae archaeon]
MNEDGIISVKKLMSDEEIINECRNALSAIDSPLLLSNGFRKVDIEMIRKGYRVLPPSFMKSLVERAIRISREIKVIETHPTSSAKNLGLNWREFTNIKDEFDAVLCVLAAFSYHIGIAQKVEAEDGEIYLVPKDFDYKIKKLNNERYILIKKS